MVLSNIDYFEFLVSNPEKIIDKWYSGKKEEIVLTKTKNEKSMLIEANEKLIEYIGVFNYFVNGKGYDKENLQVIQLLDEMVSLLKTKGINYSAFSQYFMVQNISHSLFTKLSYEEKIDILYFVLIEYLKNRHEMYSNHGYSNIILQVLSDNYSHKRKGSSGIEKIVNQLMEISKFSMAANEIDFYEDDYCYLLPDKISKTEYNKLIFNLGIEFRYSNEKQSKIPDVILKIRDHFFIVEHKNMKEPGGGQDKQISEVLDFIRYSEHKKNYHYITYLDGIFSNRLFPDARAKNMIQYKEALKVLDENPSNYFVNTYAFHKLMSDYLLLGGPINGT